MNELEGCAVLKRRFEGAGFFIHERFPFDEQGAKFEVDGFDPVRRVGYEFITTEAGDRAQITPELVRNLERRMDRGELFILLVDEQHVPTEAYLADVADHFLTEVKKRKAKP